ncbi:uncharacterized protein ColSpa_12477 [Colletotrichum spaethianum]|uniref:Uncharacterized protein n=1 Tax=Colletotrichum spaethianum TaxID=700344 RepID=A0AA37PH90_9PEZI|nr:uncharacterized protein ColSpa_12477 [Colletotrichum spaethianum]GKT52296.1 hypothetical protein ColSpa_12477 [Colletotrichum spaethianum]
MRFISFLALLTFTIAVTAKHYCLGACVKCYCGDVLYDSHFCHECNCDENEYKSKNETNPQGNCDLRSGFHLDCGLRMNGRCS